MSALRVAALAFAALGCAPDEGPVPANPTYTTDVQPIFIAHCVHCHGSNDMLHTTLVNSASQAPRYCYLQRYDNEGDCTMPTDPACRLGAGSALCTVQVPTRITETDALRMPPPPVRPLTAWQKEVITRWAANGAPK